MANSALGLDLGDGCVPARIRCGDQHGQARRRLGWCLRRIGTSRQVGEDCCGAMPMAKRNHRPVTLPKISHYNHLHLMGGDLGNVGLYTKSRFRALKVKTTE